MYSVRGFAGNESPQRAEDSDCLAAVSARESVGCNREGSDLMPIRVCFMVMPFGTKPTGADPGKGPAQIDFNALWDKALRPMIENDLGYSAYPGRPGRRLADHSGHDRAAGHLRPGHRRYDDS